MRKYSFFVIIMLSTVSRRILSNNTIRYFSARIDKMCQTGILPEGNNSAYFGIFNLDYSKISSPEGRKQLVDAIKGFNSMLISTSNELRTSIVGNVSFGKKAWTTLTEGNADLKNTGDKLIDFPGYGNAPSTQTDIYIHIHSKKDYATFEAAKNIINSFNKENPLIKVVDEKDGFVYKDSRDLTNFIDGTENPHGMQPRISAGLTEKGESYTMVQRFIHNLDKWEKVSVSEQESVIGRTKPDSVQLHPVPHNSHVGRTDVKENGKGLKIVRQSLPYGKPGSDKGLWFTAYCHDLHNIIEIERSMFGERDNVTDRILEFITPVTGAFYFTPSLEQLQKL